MDIVLLRWPSEEGRRAQLERDGAPRLLLVEEGVLPPAASGCLEDWIRLPADELEIQARLDGLRWRAEHHGGGLPDLDDDGVLRFGGSWVSIPPVEARLMGGLIARFGAVVNREQLGAVGWPEGMPGRNALDVHVLRLRRRIDPLGLAIRTVRSRGYLLEAVVQPAWRATASAAALAASTSPTTRSSTPTSANGRRSSPSS